MINPHAYDYPVTAIKDISPYFKYDETSHTLRFIGDSLEARTLRRFEVYGLQHVSDVVSTVGIMDLIIDKKYQASLIILAEVTMEPSEIDDMTFDGVPYLVMHFKHGDLFINNTQLVKKADVIYAVWMEFITRGKPLYSLDYLQLANLFDRVKQMTGSSLGVDRVVFELIIAHLSRDQNDLFKQYRYTDMDNPMELIQIRSVSYSPPNTTTRLLGSYFDNGLTASLITKTEEQQPFENILRGTMGLSDHEEHQENES